METKKAKIPFYLQRPFGEKMNASFDFLKENFKVVMKYTTYLILPLCLVQGVILNSFMEGYMEMIGGLKDGRVEELAWGTVSSFSLSTFFSIIGTLLMSALIYALIKLYNEREEGLEGVTFQVLKPMLFKNMGRLFLLTLLLTLLVVFLAVVMALLAYGTLFTLIITVPALFALLIALTMWSPVYLFEDIGLSNSFSKALRLGFATWGGVFAVLFVMGIIASVLRGVISTPWSIAIAVKSVFMESVDGGEEPSIFYNFFIYLLAVAQVFGAYFSLMFGILGASYQYGHAVEKLDSITIEDDIDNFENI